MDVEIWPTSVTLPAGYALTLDACFQLYRLVRRDAAKHLSRDVFMVLTEAVRRRSGRDPETQLPKP